MTHKGHRASEWPSQNENVCPVCSDVCSPQRMDFNPFKGTKDTGFLQSKETVGDVSQVPATGLPVREGK